MSPRASRWKKLPAKLQVTVVLGDLFDALDKKNQVGRDDVLATAFPRTGPENDKSRLRYGRQFVAAYSRKVGVFGLLIDLKLITYVAPNDQRNPWV